MARPTKREALVLQERDKKILVMINKGYPLPYVATVFNLSKGRLVQISKMYSKRSTNQNKK